MELLAWVTSKPLITGHPVPVQSCLRLPSSVESHTGGRAGSGRGVQYGEAASLGHLHFYRHSATSSLWATPTPRLLISGALKIISNHALSEFAICGSHKSFSELNKVLLSIHLWRGQRRKVISHH